MMEQLAAQMNGKGVPGDHFRALTGLERERLENEYKELLKQMAHECRPRRWHQPLGELGIEVVLHNKDHQQPLHRGHCFLLRWNSKSERPSAPKKPTDTRPSARRAPRNRARRNGDRARPTIPRDIRQGKLLDRSRFMEPAQQPPQHTSREHPSISARTQVRPHMAAQT